MMIAFAFGIGCVVGAYAIAGVVLWALKDGGGVRLPW